MVLANVYRRAKRLREKKEQTRPGGALTDTRILPDAAYAQVLVTADTEFYACGQLINEIVREPAVRLWAR